MNNQIPNVTISIDLPQKFLYVMNRINPNVKPIGSISLYKNIANSNTTLLRYETLNLLIYVKGYDQSDLSYYDEYYDLYRKVCHMFKLPHYADINHMLLKNYDDH